MTDDLLLVAALLRKEGDILLVRRHASADSPGHWALPSGQAEPGELLMETLVRVVRAETGLDIVRVGELVHVAQSYHSPEPGSLPGELPGSGTRTTAFVFEAAQWKGELSCGDADEIGAEARFWPRSKAIERLEGHPTRALREPILAYLRSEERDRIWLYRRDDEGQDQLEWPARAASPEVTEQLQRARAVVLLGCLALLALLIIIVIIGIITLARPFV